MADEPTVAPAEEQQETPDPAASETTETPAPTESPDSDPFEKRYNDLRSEFDRRNEVLAAAEGRYGPERQAEALGQFGVELAGEEDEDYEEEFDDDYPDPSEEVRALREEIEQERAERKERELDELEDRYIKQTIGELEKEHSFKLSEKEKRIVRSDAVANRLDDDRPNLEEAFADLKEAKETAREEYRESKRNPSPPPPTGSPGEDKIDLSDDETRQKYMAEVVDAEGGFGATED